MKKLLTLFVIAFSFISLSAAAQSPSHGMGMMKQRIQDSLGVSATVADSVVSVMQSNRMQIHQIMQDQSLTQDQKRDKVKPLKKEMKTKLQGILTADQLTKLEAMEQNMRQNRKGSGAGDDSNQ